MHTRKNHSIFACVISKHLPLNGIISWWQVAMTTVTRCSASYRRRSWPQPSAARNCCIGSSSYISHQICILKMYRSLGSVRASSAIRSFGHQFRLVCSTCMFVDQVWLRLYWPVQSHLRFPLRPRQLHSNRVINVLVYHTSLFDIINIYWSKRQDVSLYYNV